MAMTTCPNCGEQISDKAKKCVHCGTVLVPEEKKCCPDCGAELEEGMYTCPKCGCPIENTIETEKIPQQVEVTGVKITKKSKKIIVIATIAVIVAAIIAAIGVQTHKKKVAVKDADRKPFLHQKLETKKQESKEQEPKMPKAEKHRSNDAEL